MNGECINPCAFHGPANTVEDLEGLTIGKYDAVHVSFDFHDELPDVVEEIINLCSEKDADVIPDFDLDAFSVKIVLGEK